MKERTSANVDVAAVGLPGFCRHTAVPADELLLSVDTDIPGIPGARATGGYRCPVIEIHSSGPYVDIAAWTRAAGAAVDESAAQAELADVDRHVSPAAWSRGQGREARPAIDA